MKKVLIGLVGFIIVICGLGYGWYQMSYGGTQYYVQIRQDGEKKIEKSDTGEKFDFYYYHQNAYDKNGKSKMVLFSADHNLKHDAYLKLTYNAKKGVTSWEEVKESQLPSPTEKALKAK